MKNTPLRAPVGELNRGAGDFTPSNVFKVSWPRHGGAAADSDEPPEVSARILLVDDDPTILSWMGRVLRAKFEVVTACGPDEGLKVYEQQGPFPVVISDMRMPGMDGVEFLEAIRIRDPHSVRIMLTGFPDVETATNAVNRGAIFRFLSKTSEPAELVAAVRAAFEHHRLTQSRADLLEARLRAAQRMELVGRSAACVVHDIKNMLTVITLEAELALHETEPSDRVREYLKRIYKSATDAAGIARQLVAVGRPIDREKLAPLRMDAFLREFSSVVRTAVPHNIAIDFDLPDEMPRILADAGLLGQALLNLAVNARDAMPRGGRLTISLTVREVDEQEARSNGARGAGRYVGIRVSDTGVGLDKEQLAKLFDPFYTTKPNGNGLGMSVVMDAVNRHHGWLTAASNPGEGTTIELNIPAMPDPGNHDSGQAGGTSEDPDQPKQ